jgi:hypothetical protein
MRATRPAHLILLNFITRKVLVQFIKLPNCSRYNKRT